MESNVSRKGRRLRILAIFRSRIQGRDAPPGRLHVVEMLEKVSGLWTAQFSLQSSAALKEERKNMHTLFIASGTLSIIL